jgi:hypothetical protein
MSHVGYHECPKCGAGFATTHASGCTHAGINPRDISSPLAVVRTRPYETAAYAHLRSLLIAAGKTDSDASTFLACLGILAQEDFELLGPEPPR